MAKVGLGPGHSVLDGDPVPLPAKQGRAPNFRPISVVAKQPRRLCLRCGPSSPPLKGHGPQLSGNVRCGQTAGWTKTPLGMEVGLGLGDFVLGTYRNSESDTRYSDSPIVPGPVNSNGNRQTSTSRVSKTRERILMKLGIYKYVGV